MPIRATLGDTLTVEIPLPEGFPPERVDELLARIREHVRREVALAAVGYPVNEAEGVPSYGWGKPAGHQGAET